MGEVLIGRLDDCRYLSPDMDLEEDLPIVPKTEHSRDASPSSTESSPELEVDGLGVIPENVQVQKRKGGRKPVCSDCHIYRVAANATSRSMQPQRNGSKEIVKLKQHFESGGPSISSSWRTPSNTRMKVCRIYSRVIAPLQTNA